MEQKNYHSIVRRSTADITNESLSNVNETSTPFFCNDERLKAIMLAVSYIFCVINVIQKSYT